MTSRQTAATAAPQDPASELAQLELTASQLKLRMSDLDVRRNEIARHQATARDADRALVDKQWAVVQHDFAVAASQLDVANARITDLRAQLARSATGVQPAIAAKVATTAQPPRDVGLQQQPLRDLVFSDGFQIASFLLVFPFAIALARRVWVRNGPRPAAVDLEHSPRLQRIEQAIESIAVEVERIGEAQRFTTKLLAEREPVAGRVPAAAPLPRREPGTITPH
jgi:hypothetical protein